MLPNYTPQLPTHTLLYKSNLHLVFASDPYHRIALSYYCLATLKSTRAIVLGVVIIIQGMGVVYTLILLCSSKWVKADGVHLKPGAIIVLAPYVEESESPQFGEIKEIFVLPNKNVLFGMKS